MTQHPGGYVEPPEDGIPIRASKGEYWMSAAAVDHYGKGLMDAMNAEASSPLRFRAETEGEWVEANVSEWLTVMDLLIARYRAWCARWPRLSRLLARIRGF